VVKQRSVSLLGQGRGGGGGSGVLGEGGAVERAGRGRRCRRTKKAPPVRV
jgi:hypothetical protein